MPYLALFSRNEIKITFSINRNHLFLIRFVMYREKFNIVLLKHVIQELSTSEKNRIIENWRFTGLYETQHLSECSIFPFPRILCLGNIEHKKRDRDSNRVCDFSLCGSFHEILWK